MPNANSTLVGLIVGFLSGVLGGLIVTWFHHHDAGSDAEACARIVLAAEAAGHTRRWPSTS